MKNGRSRRHSSHGRVSAVTALPPRRPPSQQSHARLKTDLDTGRAIPLPDLSEPLVDGQAPPPLSRQARRQEQRAQAKELRRIGAQASAAIPSTSASEAPVPADLAPLPRDRSLAVRRQGVMQVADWLRGLFVRHPRSQRISPDQAVRQIQAMRMELAHMQRTLEKMLGGTA